MLELKAKCERCAASLPPESDARICTFECTFCAACDENELKGRLPKLRRQS